LTYPSRIAAVSMTVPKFDLSFLNDPDTTNNYNAGKPGRLRVDTLIGTVATNLMTNLGVKTYDLVNGGWLANQHADDNIPLLFAVNGKRDTMVGWAEKIAYYDSVNANRLGGYYFWDNRKHNGEGQQWNFTPDLMRYHRNLSYPAFSNCSFNNDPGDGHAGSGDSLGTINGFLDWKDDIEDDSLLYKISIFMRDLSTVSAAVSAPDSCFTDITLRRLQQFSVPAGAVVLWKTEHLGQVVEEDSFFYTGGLITLNHVKIFKDTITLKVSYTIPTQSSYEPGIAGLTVSAFPNPSKGNFTVRVLRANPSPFRMRLTDLSGRIMEEHFFNSSEREVEFYPETKFEDGIYFIQVFSGSDHATIKLIVGGHY
ncbi:MAG TPA: T9SS type A sorting domain-containing protein, partial [Chitinophagales bacterium]|nr:T9SS type A sorting domain-containing protein [Chitinophagales bacterium]